MPEYLTPGVYIEEVPARLKAIEGVSTSTAGFVGDTQRGPMPGWRPFAPSPDSPQTFHLPTDAAPPLVTNLAGYVRLCGLLSDDPANDPVQEGYLGLAVRAFFENGGRRCFIARAGRTGQATASTKMDTGPIVRLARRVTSGEATLFLTSLRGIDDLAGNVTVNLIRADGAIVVSRKVTGFNTQQGTVTLDTTITQDIETNEVAVNVIPGTGPINGIDGPIFHARNPGSWGNDVEVLVRSSDRPPVEITATVTDPGGGTSAVIPVRSTGSFYIGAVVEIDHGDDKTHTYDHVVDVRADRTIVVRNLSGFTSGTINQGGFARVLEIDVLINDRRTNATEVYERLCWNSDFDPAIRARHYSTVINQRSSLAYVQPNWATTGGAAETPTLALQPMTRNGFAVRLGTTTLGADGSNAPTDDQIVGVNNGPGQRTGLQSLQDIEDVRIIAAPGRTTATVQQALITQAERMRYRFAVLDGERNPTPASVVNGILGHRNLYDTSFAAYYSPWVQVTSGDKILTLPPSGYVAGVCARVDNQRGVWKAPANETVRGAVGLANYITTGEQDILNPRGVNCIRRFEGRGIRVWGARTLSSDPEYRYVNVRRFLIFMEASIDRGTQWVVFEPNAPETWTRVVTSVTAFLHTQWRDGALLGRRPEDSFFVRCDESTMTVDDIQNGRLICNIGVAIVRPAEFVIFRIEQIAGLGVAS